MSKIRFLIQFLVRFPGTEVTGAFSREVFPIYFEIHEMEGEVPICYVELPNIREDDPPMSGCTGILYDEDDIIFHGLIQGVKNGNGWIPTVKLVASSGNSNVMNNLKSGLQGVSQGGSQGGSQGDAEKTIPVIEKLLYNGKSEIPEIFGQLKIPYYDRVSPVSSIVSIINPQESAVVEDIEKSMVKNSMIIKQSCKDCLSAIDLEIDASWLSHVEGDVDITSRIAKKFHGNKINTLTPTNLESSWPRFGTNLASPSSARPSKYYVGHSVLFPENEIHMNRNDLRTPKIVIADNVPPFFIKRKWYNHKFSICYAYHQFRKETIKMKIENNYRHSGVRKKVRIDLKNIQEFVESPFSESFFDTDIGIKTYKRIIAMVENYVKISMRDIKISFSMKYAKGLTCKHWFMFHGVQYKITNLKIIANKKMKVEAMAFEKNANLFKIDPPKIEKKPPREISADDIIYDIAVENDGHTQTQKLLEFINAGKLSGNINKSNYKRAINEFLNKNNTTIKVITKPLKTQYCTHQIFNLS
ncbi:MAG: hypothetical protein LBG13_02020 [Holosporales bacterium]|jgi:hypothetical protein|nr:hypothetical protein [Holosporales bacterium]